MTRETTEHKGIFKKRVEIREGRWVCPCGNVHSNVLDTCPRYLGIPDAIPSDMCKPSADVIRDKPYPPAARGETETS